MTLTNRQKRQLLEAHLDGEVSRGDRRAVEALIHEDPAATEYLGALREVREAVRMPFEDDARGVSFDGFFDRVMARIDAEPAPLPARSTELERLAMAQADGFRLSAADSERVAAYLARTPEAREGLQSVGVMGELLRGTFEQAASRAPVGQMWSRVDRLTSPQAAVPASPVVAPTAAPVRGGVLVQFSQFIGGGRTVVASVMSAAAAVLIMMPLTRPEPVATPDEGDDKPVIVNNYYLAPPSVESVEFQSGFYGMYQPADPERDLAPVVWISPDPTAENPPDPVEVEYDPATGIPVGKPL